MNYKQYEKDLYLYLIVTFLNFFTLYFLFPQLEVKEILFPPLSSPV